MNPPWARLHTTVLPSGEARDLWLHEGVFRFDGPADAPWFLKPGGFILSGLVDSHSHLSWPHTRETPSHTPEFMNANRRMYAELGTTLLRDMGSDRDEILSLADAPGLPPVQATGMMILRDDTWPLTNTPPEKLESAMLDRVRHGAKWIKVFADFSSDFHGREDPGFTNEDELTYSEELLRHAIDAVHAAGARVAAHCFTRPGVEVSIAAGVDSLEHGWGLDETLLRRMAERQIAWVPLIGIAPVMYEMSKEAGHLDKARWIAERMQAFRQLLPLAAELGVPIYAGTDWFPNPTVVEEMIELHAAGLSRIQALAAGTWAPRTWLGMPGIEDDARADFVLYRDDPRANLDALRCPAIVVIGGVPVRPNARHFPKERRSWRDQLQK